MLVFENQYNDITNNELAYSLNEFKKGSGKKLVTCKIISKRKRSELLKKHRPNFKQIYFQEDESSDYILSFIETLFIKQELLKEIENKSYNGKGLKEIFPVISELWKLKLIKGREKALYELFRTIKKEDKIFPIFKKEKDKNWKFSTQEVKQYFSEHPKLKIRFEPHFTK